MSFRAGVARRRRWGRRIPLPAVRQRAAGVEPRPEGPIARTSDRRNRSEPSASAPAGDDRGPLFGAASETNGGEWRRCHSAPPPILRLYRVTWQRVAPLSLSSECNRHADCGLLLIVNTYIHTYIGQLRRLYRDCTESHENNVIRHFSGQILTHLSFICHAKMKNKSRNC